MNNIFWFAFGFLVSSLLMNDRHAAPPPAPPSVVVLRDELRRALSAQRSSDTQYRECSQRLYDLRRAMGGAQ